MSVQLVAAIEEIRKGMINEGKAGGQLREDACVNLSKLVKEHGKVIEPLVIAHIPAVLGLLGDKVRNVALAARTTLDSIVEIISPHSVKQILPSLLVQHTKWQANEGRLQLISRMCESSTAQMAHCLSDAIPAVCMDLTDLKPQVKDAAKKALLDLCNCCTNTDIVPFIPSLLNAMEDPSVIPETIFKLASTTFIQVVDGAALSVITPVLVRGFNKMNTTAIKRQSARIVENMSKLVEEPLYLAPFIPRILPLLEAAKEDVSDAECREVCQKAHETLLRKSDMSKSTAGKLTTQAEMLKVLNGVLAANKVHVAPHAQAYVEFVAHICLSMNEIKDFHSEDWKQHILPFLDFVFPQDQSEAVAQGIHREVVKDHEEAVAVQEVEEDAEELCNCNFSLAYGNKILLNNTHLKLKRGFRYGLVGKNDSGKTSLMRAIANHKVDGFPPEDELRTVFVETDIQGELSDLSVLNYIYADPLLANCGVSREHMATVLGSVGFVEGSPATINTPVGALSGGWKMKLALARAMLLRADILLLDEPTNHLDAYNVNWVESYLTGLKNVTCIIVSHDSGLLDRVCTHIIQIDDLKLFVHKGNLSEFVASHPEAKSYFELKTDKFKFTFPKPGNLPGITTRGKPIMKMSNVTFTYPGAPKPQLNNITIQVSMASRVACVGVNGAGKSTMIKLLTGELEPQTGDVWKHPNARVAYVAQHAFHHIENHLEKTPNEYIRWRYANGNDREALQKVTMVLTAEEEAKMKEPVMAEFTDAEGNIKREKAVIKRLTEGRRQLRNDVEYEAEFIGRQGQHWVKAERLMENGWEKVLKQIDESIAMRATMFARPLTQVNVEKHLEDVGLHREFGTHTRMAALSGGQKVKVVLAAAMWSQPHVLILDEPTNYLDRDSLGALAGAIREFEGGVVMITHNSQFCNSLCPEVWHLENNTLNVKGDAEWMQEAMKQKIETQALEEMVDAFGNVVKVAAAKKKLTRAQLKDKERKKKFMAKQGLTVDDSDDDY